MADTALRIYCQNHDAGAAADVRDLIARAEDQLERLAELLRGEAAAAAFASAGADRD